MINDALLQKTLVCEAAIQVFLNSGYSKDSMTDVLVNLQAIDAGDNDNIILGTLNLAAKRIDEGWYEDAYTRNIIRRWRVFCKDAIDLWSSETLDHYIAMLGSGNMDHSARIKGRQGGEVSLDDTEERDNDALHAVQVCF